MGNQVYNAEQGYISTTFVQSRSLQAINLKKKQKKNNIYTSKYLFKLSITSTEARLLTLSTSPLVAKLVVVLTVLHLVDLDG